MSTTSAFAPQLLLLAVTAVGILHTLVPDHWAPIVLLARQYGWERSRVARVAFGAGLGHALSTLALGVLVWAGGAIFAQKFGHVVGIASSVALITFGAWVAIGAVRELRHGSDRELLGHTHVHRHAGGVVHSHRHVHDSSDSHEVSGNLVLAPPLHVHEHRASSRLSLMLILGSSPMIEGIPAFFAASRYGIGLLAIMAALFTIATVTTYVLLCVASAEGVSRIGLGPLERYGEVASGAFIALLGFVFLLLSS